MSYTSARSYNTAYLVRMRRPPGLQRAECLLQVQPVVLSHEADHLQEAGWAEYCMPRRSRPRLLWDGSQAIETGGPRRR